MLRKLTGHKNKHFLKKYYVFVYSFNLLLTCQNDLSKCKICINSDCHQRAWMKVDIRIANPPTLGGGGFLIFNHLNRLMDLALLCLDRLLDYSNLQFNHLNRNHINMRSRQGSTKSNRLFSITLRCLKDQKSPQKLY